MGTVIVNGLEPGRRYFYRLKSLAADKAVLASSSFHTVPTRGKSSRLRFLFSSCSGRKGSDEQKTWEEISGRNDFSFILQLGDNHYADTTNPDVIAQHYLDHRSLAGFRQATAANSVYGIWDDHDFGPNNSDGETAGKDKSLQIFKQHWANPAYGEEGNPGVYYDFHYGDIHFIMLDSRYHRTPNKSKKADDPTKTMLGKRQLDWLQQVLRSSKAKVKIVCCGSEFQLHSTSDCFSGFKHEQKQLLDLFREVQGVILLSGDRHFTAAYHIRGETIEITSGPLGSSSFVPRTTPQMFLRQGAAKMYSILEIDTFAKEPKVKLEVYRVGEGKAEDRSFSWDEINGKSTIPPLKK